MLIQVAPDNMPERRPRNDKSSTVAVKAKLLGMVFFVQAQQLIQRNVLIARVDLMQQTRPVHSLAAI